MLLAQKIECMAMNIARKSIIITLNFREDLVLSRRGLKKSKEKQLVVSLIDVVKLLFLKVTKMGIIIILERIHTLNSHLTEPLFEAYKEIFPDKYEHLVELDKEVR